MRERLVSEGFMAGDGKDWSLTDKGIEIGGELWTEPDINWTNRKELLRSKLEAKRK